MSFADVAAGEPWRPESAARYNAVNELLRSYSGAVPEKTASVNYHAVDFINLSGDKIDAFTAVSVTGAEFSGSVPALLTRYHGYCLVRAVPAVDESCIWGISLDTVVHRGVGRVALAGVVPAWFEGSSGVRVMPTPGGLAAGNSGRALVLASPKTYYGEKYPGIIMLGGTSADENQYMGFFKITAVSGSEARISYPGASAYCGKTDVPGAELVAPALVTVPQGLQNIYLCFKYDGNKEYAHWFTAGQEPPDEADFFTLIGTFDNGTVYQALRIGDSTLRFGDDWYL